MPLRRLLSTLFWTFLVTSSFVMFPIALLIWAVTLPFDRRKRLLHQFTCFWASLYTWFNPAWRVRVEGREKIRPEATYLMVANHQSLLDILVLFRIFAHFKWLSKIENFRVPLIGWNMSLNRYIKLKRGDPASIRRMFESCRRTLREGSSIMVFPEGTRSPDGRMRDFKTGAFELAKSTQTPILPIVLDGTANALPKRGFVLQGRHRIRLTILDELPPESFALTILDELPPESFAQESVDQLTARVRETIAKTLESQPA
jgi:1-acyl-sn-glycerol-3-phosphate acyltransferase